MRRVVCVFVSALLLVAPVSADDGTPSLRGTVKQWVGAVDGDARMQAAFGVLMHKPAAADLVAALDEAFAPPKDAPKGELVLWSDTTSEGQQHSIYAFAPDSYDPAKPMPLLIWLHGAVSRGPDGGGQGSLRRMGETANEKGFLLLCPSGRPGALWWDPAGNGIIRNAIKEMGRRYNVDRDRIAIGGFSDGGTACYHLLVSDPSPYACFLALAGHPMVARMFGGPTHVPNLASRPVFATHGAKDRLYPTARMQPLVEALTEAGARIDWRDLPEGEHDWESGVNPVVEDALAYWHEHPRKRAPKEISWQTSLPEHYGRYEWIEIETIDESAAKTDAFEPSVLPLPPIPPPPPRLGIRLDQEFEGPGLRIEEVQADTPAQAAGMQDGDVVLEVEGVAFETFRDVLKLRGVLQKLTAEERDGTFVVLRGEDRLEIKTRPRSLAADARKPGPGHGKPLARVVAVAVGNRITVGTVNVARLKLHLESGLVDLSKPVVVVVNGKERFSGTVKPDVAYMLTEAYRLGHAPRTRAALTIRP